MKSKEILASSFRDPSGFLFFQNGRLYRQVNFVYKDDFEQLLSSGLYHALTEADLLIRHCEVDLSPYDKNTAYKILQPEIIPFISYPYEWCFSQLREAALLTLKVQKMALDYGMSLKDASAYNIQFRHGKPIFIDTLSFEKYQEGRPWVAYKQFCQHFMTPLALMRYTDIRLNQLMKTNIDGIPLDLASTLLPARTYFKFGILAHVHLHAYSQTYFSSKAPSRSESQLSRLSFLNLINHLEKIIKKLKVKSKRTTWGDYYSDTNYSEEAFQSKKQIVVEFLKNTAPQLVWDVGANDGTFSRLSSDLGILTVAFDFDHEAVEKNYQQSLKRNETNILPLLLDLTNPSASIGWANRERLSFSERGPADTLLFLALIHHLAIGNNLPFKKIAEFFTQICNSLIIEFIPKSDSQVQRLLANRKDIFPDFTQEVFESEFTSYFSIGAKSKIIDSERTVYLMRAKNYSEKVKV